MAVVSEPAKAILTARVRTCVSVIKSGWSAFAFTNFDKRSSCGPLFVVEVGRIVLLSDLEEYRSAILSWANRATGKVLSTSL